MISCSGLCRSPECFSRDRAGLGFRVIVLAPRSEVLSSAVQDQLSNVRDAQRGSSAADDEKHGSEMAQSVTRQRPGSRMFRCLMLPAPAAWDQTGSEFQPFASRRAL